MTPDTVIILTTYNRKTLVQDAIRSVLEQDCDRARLVIMDDGSNEETRIAIQQACGDPQWIVESVVASGKTLSVPYIGKHIGRSITWWQGPDRPMSERKASISYSRTLNIALSCLLLRERYVTQLCDDDWFPAESVRIRAEYLDNHPDAHVVYGRLRSIQYDINGQFNLWEHAEAPLPGREFLPPDGQRIFNADAGNARTYYLDGKVDPITKRNYIEEGFWLPGPFRYGERYRIDHNQSMIRRECLDTCRSWPIKANGLTEYWPEDLVYGVGDAGFFSRLAEVHDFIGVDCWATCKRYHKFSDGCSSAEIRE